MIETNPHDCILFDGHLDTSTGYGQVYIGSGKRTGAHRLSYIDAFGAIPDGMCVLHECDTPACIAPEHLFLGTRGDNTRDMFAKGRSYHQKKTHCPKGHEYDYVRPGTTHRRCKTCARECLREWRLRSK